MVVFRYSSLRPSSWLSLAPRSRLPLSSSSTRRRRVPHNLPPTQVDCSRCDAWIDLKRVRMPRSYVILSILLGYPGPSSSRFRPLIGQKSPTQTTQPTGGIRSQTGTGGPAASAGRLLALRCMKQPQTSAKFMFTCSSIDPIRRCWSVLGSIVLIPGPDWTRRTTACGACFAANDRRQTVRPCMARKGHKLNGTASSAISPPRGHRRASGPHIAYIY